MKEKIQRLAKINLASDLYGSSTPAMVEERRKLVRDLVENDVITLEDPPESGKFFFNQAEGQELYLEAYNS